MFQFVRPSDLRRAIPFTLVAQTNTLRPAQPMRWQLVPQCWITLLLARARCEQGMCCYAVGATCSSFRRCCPLLDFEMCRWGTSGRETSAFVS